MVPEILIVGDDARRSDLLRRVRQLGYATDACSVDAVGERLRQEGSPSAIVLCAAGAEAADLMAQLRRDPKGNAVPVALCGKLGGSIRDLADVLDLGADHFLEDPVTDEQLASALATLAGPPAEPDDEPEPADEAVEEDWHARTEVLEETAQGLVDARAHRLGRSLEDRRLDPVIGQLHRTLDLLEERLRARDRERRAGDSADDLELSLLGLEPVPGLEGSEDIVDPADSQDGLPVMRLRPLDPAVEPLAGSPAANRPGEHRGPRESTVLLEEPRHFPGAEGTASRTRYDGLAISAGLAFDAEHDASSSRLVHDRPRRAVPLPVDREGSLTTVEVPRLLWKLNRAHVTGRLTLTRGRVEKRLWFDAGHIVFARSNLGSDRLVDGLLRRGLLTRSQYETARRLAVKEPRRVGQLLVEAGFLKSGELPRVLRDHLMRVVDSTFPWNEGTWSLDPDDACHESVLLDTPTPRVIVEGIRNRMEAPQLWALLGGPRQYPRLRPEAAERRELLAEELVMSPAEEAWLDRLDGRHSLETLSAETTDELEVLAIVYGLHVLDLVDLVGEPEPQPPAAQDPAEVDRVRIEERLRLAREADYFVLLGLDRDAGRVDVRRAYAELRATFDDEALEPSLRESMRDALTELREALAEAAHILSDDALRNAYLAHLGDP